MTVFVERDELGDICCIYGQFQPNVAEEEIAADDAQVVAFRESLATHLIGE